jgi:hypothetical protein
MTDHSFISISNKDLPEITGHQDWSPRWKFFFCEKCKVVKATDYIYDNKYEANVMDLIIIINTK